MPSSLPTHTHPCPAPSPQSALIYSPWVYFFALMTAEIPWLALSLLTGPVASYFLIGLNASAVIFATNYLVLFLLSFVCACRRLGRVFF